MMLRSSRHYGYSEKSLFKTLESFLKHTSIPTHPGAEAGGSLESVSPVIQIQKGNIKRIQLKTKQKQNPTSNSDCIQEGYIILITVKWTWVIKILVIIKKKN